MNETPEQKRSILAGLLGVLTDHAELLSLEARYEAAQARRRLIGFILAGVLAFAAFILLQVCLVLGMVALGLKALWSCLILAGVYAFTAGVLVRWAAQRDPKAGAPFEGTRREWEETLSWIRKTFY